MERAWGPNMLSVRACRACAALRARVGERFCMCMCVCVCVAHDSDARVGRPVARVVARVRTVIVSVQVNPSLAASVN